jgi:2,4-diketo-3-deoxy-L-fuconate hydrolase
MKFANVAGRAALVLGDPSSDSAEIADLATVSDGTFDADPMRLFVDAVDGRSRWDELVAFAPTVTAGTGPLVEAELRCPVPTPRQVFAIGLNYRSHAEESGMAVPAVPATFTKFPASLSGPFDDIPLVGDGVDWEVELVAVIGRHADAVAEAEAWSHIAGLAVGQDVSDRHLQFAAGAQFALGKSRRGFGPIGPWLTTVDEVDDPDDLALGCRIGHEVVQDARTSDLIFSVPRLVAELSSVLPLLPSDVIFTGTPAGVGIARKPPRFLAEGDVVESWVEGLGTIRNRCVR